MAKTPIFTGSCTAIVTPYLENGVDYEKYAELIDFQYAGGTPAILVCGTTGENPTHTAEEHDKLVELTVEKCKGRMKVIVGVGGYNTEHVLEQAKQAEAAGAETAMFHSCHNVSADDLEAGATYVSLREGNLESLRQHMN